MTVSPDRKWSQRGAPNSIYCLSRTKLSTHTQVITSTESRKNRPNSLFFKGYRKAILAHVAILSLQCNFDFDNQVSYLKIQYYYNIAANKKIPREIYKPQLSRTTVEHLFHSVRFEIIGKCVRFRYISKSLYSETACHF